MTRVLLTGCSGYIGELLADRLLDEPKIDLVIGLDKDIPSEHLTQNSKFVFVHQNTIENWEPEVEKHDPTIVIHAAWQIREMFGKRDMVHQWNINGSHRVFDYVFNHRSVRTLIHFSSVASYGAYSSNTVEYHFDETHSLRHSNYVYAEEKREAELMLEDLYRKYADHIEHLPHVYILRPASITGPRGRARTSFGLQSVFLGKANANFLVRILSVVAKYVPLPITRGFARQFVHEQDVVEAVVTAALRESQSEYAVYNLVGGGEPITGSEFAKLLGKKYVYLHPELLSVMFTLLWYGTFGRIGTVPGSYKAYSYPVIVDGTRIEEELDFTYTYTSRESFTN